MTPFKPKDPNGPSQPEKVRQWIVEGLHNGEFSYGTILRYDDIAHVAGIKPEQRAQIQQIMSQGVTRLLELHHRKTLKAVPRVGYRIAHPKEHEDIGDGLGRKAKKAKSHQVRVYKATDHTYLSPEEQYRLDRKLELAQRHEAFLRRRSLRTTDIDKLVKDLPPAPPRAKITTPEPTEEVAGG